MVEAALWRAIFAWADPGFTGLPLKYRFPFFDRRLWEYLLQVPPAPWLEHKHLLREAMRDRLPESVLRRPKAPLQGQPLQAWLAENGVPAWEVDVVAAPEMACYVDRQWIDHVTHLPAAQQAAAWVHARPPLALAYWLRHRRRSQLSPLSSRS
jgi:asparagine synthase (glutamine-hydrolysing)